MARMMHASKISDQATPTQIKVEGVEIRLVRLPLVEPFETSFGKIDSRLIFLVCLNAGGLKGWGEVVASEQPLYSYETVGTAFHVIKDFLAPAVLDEPITDLEFVSSCTVTPDGVATVLLRLPTFFCAVATFRITKTSAKV